jgi:hypothetical protein
MQLALPLQVESRRMILGQPIKRTILIPGNYAADVLTGRFAGACYVYLLHFDRKIARAQHYLGSAVDLERRLKQHQHTYPCFRFSESTFASLPKLLQDKLQPLQGKIYRRHHTILKALQFLLGDQLDQHRFAILRAAKQHTGSSGLVMAANQRGIPWQVAKVWQADRSFEKYLKSRKGARLFCPMCNGDDLPF